VQIATIPKSQIKEFSMTGWPGVIRAYQKYLPFDESIDIITLNEGNTPLIRADRLAEIIAPKAGLKLY
jgi:threonine synthase